MDNLQKLKMEYEIEKARIRDDYKDRPFEKKRLLKQAESSYQRQRKQASDKLPLKYKESDLQGFSEEQKSIFRLYCENVKRPHGEIAEILGIDVHVVTGCMESKDAAILINRLYKESIQADIWTTLLEKIRGGGDNRQWMLTAKELGVYEKENEKESSNDGSEALNEKMRIEHPEVLEAMHAIGNWLVDYDEDSRYDLLLKAPDNGKERKTEVFDISKHMKKGA
jgi:hypothetical protein